MPAPVFTACIFDFDGVIINSEPLHAEAQRHTLTHYQISIPPGVLAQFYGRPDANLFAYVDAEITRGNPSAPEMDAFKRREYLQLFEQVPLVPGSLEFVQAARGRFRKIGLATSATIRDLSLAVRKYRLESCFDVIVTGDDTLQHKPHPEPYLKALAALSLRAADTLVIEDSPNGIRAAKAAGCTVAALTTSFSSGQVLSAGADFVFGSFAELESTLELA